jgi:hypothetical protein
MTAVRRVQPRRRDDSSERNEHTPLSTISDLAIEAVIDQGGQAIVYRARQPKVSNQFACSLT